MREIVKQTVVFVGESVYEIRKESFVEHRVIVPISKKYEPEYVVTQRLILDCWIVSTVQVVHPVDPVRVKHISHIMIFDIQAVQSLEAFEDICLYFVYRTIFKL